MLFQAQALSLLWAATCAAQISGKVLRIAPLGDSITVGEQSSTLDGWRRPLVALLDGNQVNMIGCRANGKGRDNQHQGYSGAFINDVQNRVNCTYSSKPNIYLLHAGTNNLKNIGGDCTTSAGLPACQDAANQLAQLVDTIVYLTNTAALVVVAKIVPSGNSAVNKNIPVYNSLVEKLVRARDYPGTGYRIQLADMAAVVTQADLADGTHPNDGGYNKMATVWYNSIVNASVNGLIQPPADATGYASLVCGSSFPTYNFSNGVIYNGRGQGNVYLGPSCSDVAGTNNCVCNDNDGTANYTTPRIGSCKEMSLGFTSAVKWADLNGDGRQETVWTDNSGRLNTTVNIGAPNFDAIFNAASLQSTWNELGFIKPTGASAKRYQVRLADINGDSRAEYMVVQPNGQVDGFFNTGDFRTANLSITVNWASQSNTVSPSRGLSGVGVRMVDFDGDGRADYVWVSSNGTVQVWLNKANTANSAAVTNWVSQGTVGPAVLSNTLRENVIIQDVDADGRADYLIVNRGTGEVGCYLNKPPASGSNTPNWVWKGLIVSANTASQVGATNFLADVQFADPDGDNQYDYIVVQAGDSSIQAVKNSCVS